MNRALIFAACVWSLPVLAADWKPRQAPLMTKWAADVSPENVHSEYPRPQMVRDHWLNLNGLWDYSIVTREAPQPTTWESDKILVPFPVESALSGVMKNVGPDHKLWYRRSFSILAKDGRVDPAWSGKNLLLHFGAVDWETTVWINGKEIGSHKGGYDPFSFDVTSAIKPNEPNELVVSVVDPSDAGFQGRGKQVRKPGGIFYTPTTGIWQTVWIEPVPTSYIRGLVTTPDLDKRQLRINVDVANPRPGSRLGLFMGSSQKPNATDWKWHDISSNPIVVSLEPYRGPGSDVWSPTNPHLIDVVVALADAPVSKPTDPLTDSIRSYTALRKISLGKDSQGVNRILLNNEPLFQVGPLDQGFWPDGLYTAPTDAALKFDIEQTKAYGFNMIRKHVKVESQRWYHYCDKLGMLVWQDMPSGDRSAQWDPNGRFDNTEFQRSPESAADYRREWKSIIDARRNHPCIVMWVPFNEGWGQSDTVAVTKWTKEYDPSRLVNCASGGNDFPVGDVIDVHRYPGPFSPVPTEQRAAVLGEFGGLGLPLEGHTWQAKANWGYRSFADQKSLTDAYVDLFEQLHPMIASPGLSAAIYTQTTDVETEVNGLMTYDRKVLKIPVAIAAKSHQELHQPPSKTRIVVPTSQTEAQTWKYTLEKPSGNWEATSFAADDWKSGPGGFGEKSTPGSVVRTEWKSNDIWLRRPFELKTIPKKLRLSIHHDEDAEIYFNGVLAAKVTGYSTNYHTVRVSPEGLAALKEGTNLLAVHCKQTGGGQYIDVGLVEFVDP